MPISGLVITLNSDPVAARQAAGAIAGRAGFNCGAMRGDHHLPAVLDTADRDADKAARDWLHALPGVLHVDVVFIHFDDQDAPSLGATPLGTHG